MKIGNPMDDDTDIGPVARREFVGYLEKILEDAKKKGPKPVIYGNNCEKGFFSGQLLSLQPGLIWKPAK